MRAPGAALSVVTLAFPAAPTTPALAEGGPPTVTDDPEMPGDGHWGINVAWTFERSCGPTASDAPLIDAN